MGGINKYIVVHREVSPWFKRRPPCNELPKKITPIKACIYPNLTKKNIWSNYKKYSTYWTKYS
jgi:hypothetical protein